MAEEIRLIRYADKRRLSYWQAVQEPNHFIELSFLVWKMDMQHDRLNSKEA